MSNTQNYTSEVTNCYNVGKITSSRNVGGIVGEVYGENNNIKYCYNTGDIEGKGSSRYQGSIVGYKWSGTIENCYYLNTSKIKAIKNEDDEANNVYSLTDEYMKSAEFVDQLNSSSSNVENIWKLEKYIYKYPVLNWQKDPVIPLESIRITMRTYQNSIHSR